THLGKEFGFFTTVKPASAKEQASPAFRSREWRFRPTAAGSRSADIVASSPFSPSTIQIKRRGSPSSTATIRWKGLHGPPTTSEYLPSLRADRQKSATSRRVKFSRLMPI